MTNALGGAPQSDFFHKLSADLESADLARANQIRDGHLYSGGTIQANTADFVHFEQGKVQRYAQTINDANSSLNGPLSSLAKLTDPTFSRAVSATQRALGRDIDFASQRDREALGNAVANELSRSSSFCTGSHILQCN